MAYRDVQIILEALDSKRKATIRDVDGDTWSAREIEALSLCTLVAYAPWTITYEGEQQNGEH